VRAEVTDAWPVVSVKASETRFSADLLAESFAEDPLARFLFPDSTRRLRVLRSLFLRVVRDALSFGAVDAVRAGEALAGICVSLPPGAFPPSRMRNARIAPTLLLATILYPTSLDRLRRVLRADAAAHVSEPHWYIEAIGVDDHARHQGIGTRLLEAVLVRADAETALTFLVTSNERNLDWYRRYGFTVTDEVRVLPHAPPFWPMARRPAE
jgi:ribosomal protein S18 acetylase RimI-like enzyme